MHSTISLCQHWALFVDFYLQHSVSLKNVNMPSFLYIFTQRCFLDSHQSRNKLPGVKVGGKKLGCKNRDHTNHDEPPEPYQNTTHHCSQSIFYYDTNYNFCNKEKVGEYHHHTKDWGFGWGYLVSSILFVAPTQLNAIYLWLASWTGRFPFALIGIMSVGQFLHHLQAAETKHVQKESYKSILLNKTIYQEGFQKLV